jgi:GNAT superfamily N-acetyltransferase
MGYIRTDSKHKDFITLVQQLDLDLSIRDGEDHDFYNQFNSIDKINNVILVYKNRIPIGCGAFNLYEGQIMEIKRMFTLPAHRGKGVASEILNSLEKWANELQFTSAILETGIMQPEAIELYKKNNYRITENYGVYIRS